MVGDGPLCLRFMREYQKRISQEALESLEHHDRIVVASPTGSGKTVTALQGILPGLKGKSLWVTHRKELLDQVKLHRVEGLDIRMIQALRIIKDYDNVIIDEGHHVCASQYATLFERFQRAKFIALTATPYRMDGEGLGSCGFSAIIHGPDVYELTVLGFLSECRVLVSATEEQKAWEVNAAASVIHRNFKTSSLVYCRTVEDAWLTSKALKKLGIRAASVDADTKPKDRIKACHELQRLKLKALCNHTIFTEGYDAPAIDLLVLNRLTASRCLWRQMIGRGLRPSPGKAECLVLDLAGNGITHGSIYDREIFNLDGSVQRTESRTLAMTSNSPKPYDYQPEQPLKEWKPRQVPNCLSESLQKLKSKSSPLRFLTG